MNKIYFYSIAFTSLCTTQSFAMDNLSTEIPVLIDSAYNSGTPSTVIKNKVVQLASSATNNKLDQIEETTVDSTDFTHLELSIGSDSFDLDSGTGLTVEGIGVYRLYESDDLFVFNQSSFVLFDDRNTLNTGFGVRTINDAETLILGTNIFYDYESSSGHTRYGYGLEAITSLLEFRANQYKAISGTIEYKGIYESTLDGYDYSVTAQLPYFYSSNIYAKQSNWKDTQSYAITQKEWGVNAEILPNLNFRIASQKTDNNTAKLTGSITYTKQFGAGFTTIDTADETKTRLSTKLGSVREKLYKPVQRENRIIKKAIKLGVTVSGY